jgi:ABC-type transport system involved in Fe-S cluster assembly fused permease/ATPase subunit
MNNVRYARIAASDKEVYEACKAAAVHDKIMSFPDGKFAMSVAGCVFLLTTR